jgi:deoxyribodipyrimidine photo-lyase
MSYNLSIFIFRRDLRLEDNTGLIEALKQSNKVLPIFIFTPEQITSKNEYKSDNSVQFLMESLDDLNQSLIKNNSKLIYFYGDIITVLKSLIQDLEIDSIFVNQDYTPYSKERDNKIENFCTQNNIIFNSHEDICLLPINSVKTGAGDTYKVFTPYHRVAEKIKVRKVIKNNHNNYYNNKKKLKHLCNLKKDIKYIKNDNIRVRGGRENALQILKNIKNFQNYNVDRNFPSLNTTSLSAYNKYGCVSIREVYDKFTKVLKKDNSLIKQLYWRDFYYNIAYTFPHVFGNAFKEKYDNIKWKYNKKYWESWINGTTGFPLQDAGMRELNQTGFMHNRCRMITTMFLTKDLLIDWKLGEKYFAQKLVDYDPSQNNGGHQWSASTGTDSQPYFRIFNPWTQQKKYDKDCEYIKKWIPELNDVPDKHIHEWNKYCKEHSDIDYPEPIVVHDIQRKKALELFKNL